MIIMIKPYDEWPRNISSKADFWYKPGQVYDVVPYRYNGIEYWELADWTGNKEWQGAHYWIVKKHTVPYCLIPRELFEL